MRSVQLIVVVIIVLTITLVWLAVQNLLPQGGITDAGSGTGIDSGAE